MWIYLLSLLNIGIVQSLTITYPYRPLLAYDPIRTQIFDKPSTAQGFLVYLDNGGIERIVAYNYAEPVYAIRRISYINSGTPVVQTLTADDTNDDTKAREAHFRAWSLHQYQVLKQEIDLLKAEGKEPSIEMKLKFLPLEKIALTPDFTTIADLPEIQRIRKEYFNIWKQIEQSNQKQIKEDNANNYIGTPSVVFEDPLTQKLNNEQQFVQNPHSNIMLLLKGDKSVIDKLNATKTLDELKNVKPEIIFANKIDIETKVNKSLEANDSELKIGKIKLQSEGKNYTTSKIDEEKNSEESKKRLQPQQVFHIPKIVQESNDNEAKSEKGKIQSEPDEKISISTEKVLETISQLNISQLKPQDVVNIPEVVEAPEEPLNLVSKGKLQSGLKKLNSTIFKSEKEHQTFTTNSTTESQISEQLNEKNLNNVINQTSLNLKEAIEKPLLNLVMEEKNKSNVQKKVQSEVEKLISTAPKIYVPQQVIDTDEVIHARNEHLRIVKEALQKAKIAQAQKKQPEVSTELAAVFSNGKGEENVEIIQENKMD